MSSSVQVLANQAPGLAGERHVVGLGHGEDVEQESRVVLQLSGVGDLELSAHDPEAPLHVFDAPALRRGPDPGQTLLHDERGVGQDVSSVDVVIAHEVFDRKLSSVVVRTPVAEYLRDPLLMLEAHLVVLASPHEVELVANPPEEVEPLEEVRGLLLREETAEEVVVLSTCASLGGVHHPSRSVVVAQTSGALLDVWLQQVERVAELGVPTLEGDDLL
jgi:hypothetical protein